MKNIYILLIVLVLSLPVFAWDDWGRTTSGGGSTETPTQKFYDFNRPYPNALKMPSQTLEIRYFSHSGNRAFVCKPEVGHSAGYLDYLWLNPAGDAVTATNGYSSTIQRRNGPINWELMLLSYNNGIIDTLTKLMTGDTTFTGSYIPYSAFAGFMGTPTAEFANEYNTMTVVRSSDRTYASNLNNLRVEFIDSLEIYIRPMQWSGVNYIGMYATMDYYSLPSIADLYNRRAHFTYRTKRVWRYDWFPFTWYRGSSSTPALLRWWGLDKEGTYPVRTNDSYGIWKKSAPYADSLETSASATTYFSQFLEENVFLHINDLPVLTTFRGYDGDSTITSTTSTADSLKFDPLIGYNIPYNRTNVWPEFFLFANNRIPTDSSFWCTDDNQAVWYDTTGTTWKLRLVTGSATTAETFYRPRSAKLICNNAKAWFIGNWKIWQTGTEDRGGGYYNRVAFSGNRIAYLAVSGLATDSVGSNFTQLHNEFLQFNSGLCISAVKSLTYRSDDTNMDTLTVKMSGASLFYTNDLLSGNPGGNVHVFFAGEASGFSGNQIGASAYWNANLPQVDSTANVCFDNLTMLSGSPYFVNCTHPTNSGAVDDFTFLLPFKTKDLITSRTVKNVTIDLNVKLVSGSANTHTTDSILVMKYVPHDSNTSIDYPYPTDWASWDSLDASIGGIKLSEVPQITSNLMITLPTSTFVSGKNTFLLLMTNHQRNSVAVPSAGEKIRFVPYATNEFDIEDPGRFSGLTLAPKLLITLDSLVDAPLYDTLWFCFSGSDNLNYRTRNYHSGIYDTFITNAATGYSMGKYADIAYAFVGWITNGSVLSEYLCYPRVELFPKDYVSIISASCSLYVNQCDNSSALTLYADSIKQDWVEDVGDFTSFTAGDANRYSRGYGWSVTNRFINKDLEDTLWSTPLGTFGATAMSQITNFSVANIRYGWDITTAFPGMLNRTVYGVAIRPHGSAPGVASQRIRTMEWEGAASMQEPQIWVKYTRLHKQ